MTKLFCDLCGAPAMEELPKFKTSFQNVDARIIFETADPDLPNRTSGFHPDLCGNCIANLLRKMADTIK